MTKKSGLQTNKGGLCISKTASLSSLKKNKWFEKNILKNSKNLKNLMEIVKLLYLCPKKLQIPKLSLDLLQFDLTQNE